MPYEKPVVYIAVTFFTITCATTFGLHLNSTTAVVARYDDIPSVHNYGNCVDGIYLLFFSSA